MNQKCFDRDIYKGITVDVPVATSNSTHMKIDEIRAKPHPWPYCEYIPFLIDEISRLKSKEKSVSDYWSRVFAELSGIIKSKNDEISRLTAKVEQLEAELAAYREAEHKSCEYKIHIPSEEGYPDVKGRFYECSCGTNYIDIEAGQEWQRCPHCGKPISSFETLACISCNNSEWDGDSYYCEAKSGTYHGEEVTHANFDGCKSYEPRKEADVALQRR